MPMLVCSSCFTECSIVGAHVIPWWDESAHDFLTAYRCDNCLPQALAEVAERVQGWDTSARDKFCEFLDRHQLASFAQQLREASPPEASRLAKVFLDLLKGGKHRLVP